MTLYRAEIVFDVEPPEDLDDTKAAMSEVVRRALVGVSPLGDRTLLVSFAVAPVIPKSIPSDLAVLRATGSRPFERSEFEDRVQELYNTASEMAQDAGRQTWEAHFENGRKSAFEQVLRMLGEAVDVGRVAELETELKQAKIGLEMAETADPHPTWEHQVTEEIHEGAALPRAPQRGIGEAAWELCGVVRAPPPRPRNFSTTAEYTAYYYWKRPVA
jgi:hypothetical protein